MITSIEQLTEDAVLVICEDEQAAKKVLKRNATCSVTQKDGRFALLYHINDTNLINAIKRK